jgi:hypothetical protein
MFGLAKRFRVNRLGKASVYPYEGYRYPTEIISHAVRFSLSLRDVMSKQSLPFGISLSLMRQLANKIRNRHDVYPEPNVKLETATLVSTQFSSY